MKFKESFTIEDVDVQTSEMRELELAFIRPTPDILQKARMVHNKTFADALKGGALLRASLNSYMKDQGLWNEEREKEHRKLLQSMNDNEKKLAGGNIKLSEGRKVAIELRKIRQQISDLLVERTNLDTFTAEGQSENMRFNFLLSQCLVDNKTGKPYYKSVEDYLERANEHTAFVAANKFATLHFGVSEDFDATLPENKFLRQWGFADEKFRLINKDSHFVNEDGKLVNEFGQLVNESDQLVDMEGNSIDERGNYIPQGQPFLDEEGNPIKECQEEKVNS